MAIYLDCLLVQDSQISINITCIHVWMYYNNLLKIYKIQLDIITRSLEST